MSKVLNAKTLKGVVKGQTYNQTYKINGMGLAALRIQIQNERIKTISASTFQTLPGKDYRE